jgi:hypothetical protein
MRSGIEKKLSVAGSRRVGADQFRASLQRHLDALIEEEEGMWDERLIHEYAASLLREVKAWVEVES